MHAVARRIYNGDPPPAEAPDKDAVWSDLTGTWTESDAALRRRLKAQTDQLFVER